jgi:hypothetical protein
MEWVLFISFLLLYLFADTSSVIDDDRIAHIHTIRG